MYADDITIYFNLEDFPAIHREHTNSSTLQLEIILDENLS